MGERLTKFQADLFERAKAEMKSHTKQVTIWDDFMGALDDRNIALVPWCGGSACEKDIKTRSGKWADEKEAKGESPAAEAAAAATADAALDEHGEKVEKLTGAAKSLCIPFEQPGNEALLTHNQTACCTDPSSLVLMY